MLSRFSGPGGPSGVRRRLAYSATIAVIAVLCGVVAGHDLFRTWEDRDRQLENTDREAANLAWAAEQNAQAAFLLSSTILADLAERVETDGTGAPELDRLRLIMAQRLAASPVLQNLYVIGDTGMLLADGGSVIQSIDLSDRAYFQYHKTQTDPHPYVSAVLRSRLSGKPVISVSIRINRPDGSFAGIAEASVETGYFQEFYATLDLGHDGLASLYRDDGTLLVRQPFQESAAGENSNGI